MLMRVSAQIGGSDHRAIFGVLVTRRVGDTVSTVQSLSIAAAMLTVAPDVK